MAKYGPSSVTISMDDAPGGTLRVITPYVTTVGDIGLESITQQTNPFGVASEQHTPIGLDRTPDITISGFFDDTATVGPKAMFFNAVTWALDKAPGSAGRTLTIVVASGMTFTVEVHLVDAKIGLKRDGLTEYSIVVRQMGAGAWS